MSIKKKNIIYIVKKVTSNKFIEIKIITPIVVIVRSPRIKRKQLYIVSLNNGVILTI